MAAAVGSGLADPGRTHERGVIAVMAAGQFEEHRVAGFKVAAAPGAVRHAASGAARDQGLHADILGPRRDGGAHHGGDQVVFGGARLNGGEPCAHAQLGILGGHFDLFDLAPGLDHTKLLDQAGGVGDLAQPVNQGLVDRDGQEPAALVEPDLA